MNHSHQLLKPGTLWSTLLARSAHARERGAILSIPTEPQIIEQGGVTFQVRIITALAMKALATAAQSHNDPFLPYDPDLFVADISSTHVALLNKFNVIDHHLLIVTRAFEDQQTPLTGEDFAALLIGLAEIDGLGFYNAGQAAGASQRHKHLQLVPLSAFPHSKVPIEPLLQSVKMNGNTGTVSGLPFPHAYARMDPKWFDQKIEGSSSLLDCYRSLQQAVGLPVEAGGNRFSTLPPYNLLATREWLLLVPRSREYFNGISVNALGFAGALHVKDKDQLEALRRQGPMAALQYVALPSKT
jgi:ATP adenylyltransferase